MPDVDGSCWSASTQTAPSPTAGQPPIILMLYAVLHKGTKNDVLNLLAKAMQCQIQTQSCKSDDPISHLNFFI
jgi:hypothetical protein